MRISDWSSALCSSDLLTPLSSSFFESTSGTCMSTRRFGSFGLVIVGALGGVLISLGITAAAQRGDPLPLKELQQFANVFAAIKSSYVEPVTDKQLIDRKSVV